MNRVDLHHRSAMVIFDVSLSTVGDERVELLALAMENELLAAKQLAVSPDAEPSRSVLYRSAACLALRAARPARAQAIAHEGLRSPFIPIEIEAELREVVVTADRMINDSSQNQEAR